MAIIDLIILVIYLLVMLGIGFFFMGKNQGIDDYFVGGRDIKSFHVGLSVVATDVGGGFSIGLGGLGFAMGLAGTWMLFTGLLGAWMAAVLLIPRVKELEATKKFLSFPQIFDHYYGSRVALVAALISTIGYIGFTASQLLAGAKLASATFVGIDLQTALISMGVLAVVYTSMGGIKAVIYTDTAQWLILMAGLIFVGIPVAHFAVGGFPALSENLPTGHMDLFNIEWQTLVNWGVTIIPIWFIGMTLYQRIYACKDVQTAKRAWYIAGLLEYPIMAFMGVLLGLYARVALETGLFTEIGFAPGASMDSELGMPLLLRTILPVGLMGLVMAAYFSAILSTADSCLMAASGSVVTDLIKLKENKTVLRTSQLVTLGLGIVSIVLASLFSNVLTIMLYSYSFMVSGLLVPLIGALFFKKRNPMAAMASMLVGGFVTVALSLQSTVTMPFGLDYNVGGISASILVFCGILFVDRFNKT